MDNASLQVHSAMAGGGGGGGVQCGRRLEVGVLKPILCISTQRRMRFKPLPLVFYHFGPPPPPPPPPVPIKPTRSNLAVYLTLLIAHLQKIAFPQALLHEPSPTLASANNLSILKKLKCALCSNVLSQPLELTCSSLVCTKCLTECIAASGAVSCPCC